MLMAAGEGAIMVGPRRQCSVAASGPGCLLRQQREMADGSATQPRARRAWGHLRQ